MRRVGAAGLTTGNPRCPLDVVQPLAGGATPCLYLDQNDTDTGFLAVDGDSAAADLTRNIVSETDVTTGTRIGFIKAAIIDNGGQVTPGNYYIPLFTLA